MPDPPDGARPVHAAEQVSVPANSRARITFTPEESGTVFGVPILAIAKRPLTTYEIEADGTTRFEQSAVPPTDVDDLSPCFFPAFEFRTDLTIIIRNTDTVERKYAIQVVGWEADSGVSA